MQFSTDRTIEVIERTPAVLTHLLAGLSSDWVRNNEGPDTWSPFDIVGHLVHAERTNWMERLLVFFSDAGERTFAPFDRFAQLSANTDRTPESLLEEFAVLRAHNVAQLHAMNITEADFARTATHPDLGEVQLQQLLATWAAHDLAHTAQIVRVMAKQYADAVGPWRRNLSILNR